MNRLNRGSFSFVALLVINPIVILMYQNCSVSPLSQSHRQLANTHVEVPNLASQNNPRAPASQPLLLDLNRGPSTADKKSSAEYRSCATDTKLCTSIGLKAE